MSVAPKFLMMPDLKSMSAAIEEHVEEHRQKVKNPVEAEVVAERVRNGLIGKALQKASELGK